MPLTSEDRSEVATIFQTAMEPLLRSLFGNRIVAPTVEPEPVSDEERAWIEKTVAPEIYGVILPYNRDSDAERELADSRSIETLRRRKGYWVAGHELRFHNMKHQLQCVNIETVRAEVRKRGLQMSGPKIIQSDRPREQGQGQNRPQQQGAR